MLLKNLSVPMKTITGETIIHNGKPITLQRALVDLLGYMRGEDGVESLKVYHLGGKLMDAEDEFTLKEADTPLLQKAVDQNMPGFYAAIIGQCHAALHAPPEKAIKKSAPKKAGDSNGGKEKGNGSSQGDSG